MFRVTKFTTAATLAVMCVLTPGVAAEAFYWPPWPGSDGRPPEGPSDPTFPPAQSDPTPTTPPGEGSSENPSIGTPPAVDRLPAAPEPATAVAALIGLGAAAAGRRLTRRG